MEAVEAVEKEQVEIDYSEAATSIPNTNISKSINLRGSRLRSCVVRRGLKA